MIRGIFPNAEGDLMPGFFVRVRVPIGEQDDALLVPQIAVGSDQAGSYLLVVNSDNKVERRDVSLGTRVDTFIVVEDGLKAGESVIVEGVQRARPGTEVTPQETVLTPPEDIVVVEEGSAAMPEDVPATETDGGEPPAGGQDVGPTVGEDDVAPDSTESIPPTVPGTEPPSDPTVTPPVDSSVTPPVEPGATTTSGTETAPATGPASEPPTDPATTPPTESAPTPPSDSTGAPSAAETAP
jgi:hypothetical protein